MFLLSTPYEYFTNIKNKKIKKVITKTLKKNNNKLKS